MIPSSNQNVKYPGNNITQWVLILHISLTTGDIFMMNLWALSIRTKTAV